MKTLQLIELNKMNWFDSIICKQIISIIDSFKEEKVCYHKRNVIKKNIKKFLKTFLMGSKITELNVVIEEGKTSVYLKTVNKKSVFNNNHESVSVFNDGYLIER